MERLKQLEEAQAITQKENEALKAEIAKKDKERKEKDAADDAARLRHMPLVGGPVDTRLMNKPDTFNGKEEEWPQFALLTRAYIGAVSPKMFELLMKAESELESIVRVDLDPGDDLLDSQLYYIMTMLIKGTAIDKV